MVFFVRITANQSHLRPICKSTKFNPKIQGTIYLINFQRLRLHVLDFIRTVVKYNKKVAMIVVCISNKMLIYTKSENPENDVFWGLLECNFKLWAIK